MSIKFFISCNIFFFFASNIKMKYLLFIPLMGLLLYSCGKSGKEEPNTEVNEKETECYYVEKGWYNESMWHSDNNVWLLGTWKLMEFSKYNFYCTNFMVNRQNLIIIKPAFIMNLAQMEH